MEFSKEDKMRVMEMAVELVAAGIQNVAWAGQIAQNVAADPYAAIEHTYKRLWAVVSDNVG